MITKLYPIQQVALDICGEDSNFIAELDNLNKIAKGPTKSKKNKGWVDLESNDTISSLLYKAILEHRLPAIDENGCKLDIPKRPDQFNNLYVTVDEVNQLIHEEGHRFTWSPSTRKKKPKPVSMSWKIIYQHEASNYYIRTWNIGAQPNRVNCAEYLQRWGVQNNKRTDYGKPPSLRYIRQHVIGTKYWQEPQKPTP